MKIPSLASQVLFSIIRCGLFLLGISLIACGPGRAVQKYAYLTETTSSDTSAKNRPTGSETSPSSQPGDSKTPSDPPSNRPPTAKGKKSEVDIVVQTALSYQGTPYKYGGMSRRGMDCSGLVNVSFQAADKSVPRRSQDMADQGKSVSRKKIRPGHLVLFSAKGGRGVDHVGLVVAVEGDNISFIHSTTSRGVRIDTLDDPYWGKRFRKAVAF